MLSSNFQIGWKVASLTKGIASVRYRALLPILALESNKVRNRLFASSCTINLEGLDALVIVKSFTSDDLFLAQKASSKGVFVVFDLCDNIFIDNLTKRIPSPVPIFDSIAAVADCVVVTTEPLAEIVRNRSPNLLVAVIPDGIETPVLLKEMDRLLAEAKNYERANHLRVMGGKLFDFAVRFIDKEPGLLMGSARRVLGRGLGAFSRYLSSKSWRFSDSNKVTTDAGPEARESEVVGKHAKTILWFGNHGAAHARFGMLDLLEIRDALEKVAQSFDVELVVISNHREKYDEHIRPFNIPSRYLDWSPQVVHHWLGEADVVVVPNTLDPFSLCKSANRTVLAISRGVPVVATLTPALGVLSPYVHTGDALAGLQRYLSDREEGQSDARAAYALAQSAFGQEAIAQMWQTVLSNPRTIQRVEAPAQCVVALNLIQDLDLARPVLDACARQGVSVQVWCSAALIRKSPRVLATIEAHRVAYRVLPDDLPKDSVVFPSDTKTLLTISETNLGPHRFTRKLSDLALAKGLTVATMQHGFENVGLTYDDAVHPIDRVSIKAQRIYIWGGLEMLHPKLDAGVRDRCIVVGCPKPSVGESIDIGHLIPKDRPVVGIFENLHWHRYDDSYRQAFLGAVWLLAEHFPQVTFLVKPHHAGMWLTKRYDGERPAASNLVIADPQIPAWEPYTASALLGRMAAVITTPSTVALDAARQGLPVAVYAGGLDLSNYQPLPLLRDSNEWSSFVRSALDITLRTSFTRAAALFVARVLVEGDGAQRIVADLADIVPSRAIPINTFSKDSP